MSFFVVDRYSNSRIIGTDATYVQTLYYTAWSTLRPFFAEDINVKEAATRTLQATALNWLLLTLTLFFKKRYRPVC